MSCPFCGGTRSDRMVVHAWDCEWCTLVQRVERIEEQQAFLWRRTLQILGVTDPMPLKEAFENGSNESPVTQRSVPGLGFADGSLHEQLERAEAADRPELHPDSRPTEPSCAPDPGADAASGGPEGTEPRY